ncbi:MAG: recombinase family protein [Candidatus Nanopelagicales bacterium]|nr:recombinase family protein [Candidatus Nanopelagicales bacterium]
MSRRLAAVPDTPPRAVLYLRQSVSREDSISIELQETACRDHAARLGYTVVAVESDPGISGRTWDRPAVQRVMGMIAAREADIVLLWKWSRLSRSRRDWAVAVDKIEAAGGRVESATEPVDATTATGRFTRGMLAEMAAFESDRMGEVWKEVHQRRISKGLPSRGGPRFGYQRQDDGTYLVDPLSGPLLAQAYQRVADGHSTRAVTAWLNASGARTLAGRPWTRDRLTRVLDSGFGAGLLVRQGRRGTTIDRRLEALTWEHGIHPAVIDPDTWEAYLAARRTQRAQPTGQPGTYVLSGLVRCGDCGAPMWIDRLGREAGYAYVCSAWKTDRSARCVSMSRHRIEEAVIDWLQLISNDLEEVAKIEEGRARSAVAEDAEVTELAREANRLEQRQQKLVTGWLDGTIPQAAYVAERDRITATQEATSARLDAITRSRRERASMPLREAVTGLRDEWDGLPVEDRRLLLGRLIERVTVIPPERRGQRATAVVTPRT